MAGKYKIVRRYQNDYHATETIKRGLTLDEPQAWCSAPETSSSTATSAAAVKRTAERGAWFDGYEDQER